MNTIKNNPAFDENVDTPLQPEWTREAYNMPSSSAAEKSATELSLLDKCRAEFTAFEKHLLESPPGVILSRATEYTSMQDTLMAVQGGPPLPKTMTEELLKDASPLATLSNINTALLPSAQDRYDAIVDTYMVERGLDPVSKAVNTLAAAGFDPDAHNATDRAKKIFKEYGLNPGDDHDAI